jgi:Zn-dependent protease
MSNFDWYETVVIVGLVVYSISLHELAHAWTATWCGDPTPGRHGRLTWNPIVQLHPIYSMLLPVVSYFWANWPYGFAFTPVDPSRFRRPLRDGALVGVAGPLANLLVAGVFIGLFYIPGLAEPPKLNCRIFYYAAYWNLMLAAFNLLPLPGLDGYDILRTALPLQTRSMMDRVRKMGFIPILIILVLGPPLLRHAAAPLEAVFIRMVPEDALRFVLYGL